jgi:DNA modification methylase
MARLTHLDQIQPDPRNPRAIDDASLTALQFSEETFGDLSGLVWNRRTGHLVSGHQRLKALRGIASARGVEIELKDGEVYVSGEPALRFPVREVDWPIEKQRAANVAANNPHIGGKFTDGLASILEELTASNAELVSGLRLDLIEIPDLEEDPDASPGGGPDDDVDHLTKRIAELEVTWRTELGQVWRIPSKTVPGRAHRVVCGDSTAASSYQKACGNETPWIMVTDPPYGVKYDPNWRTELDTQKPVRATGKVLNDDTVEWTEAYRLFQGDVAYVWHAGLYAGTVAANLQETGLEPRAQIIWVKQHFAFGRGDYHWQHEPCWYVVRKGRPGRRTDDRSQVTTWPIANNNPFGGGHNEDDEATGHGTQKPLECMQRPIRNHNLPDGTCVYDPFLGSGTTLVAAEREGHICVGCELSPGYLAVILQRCANLGLEPILESDASDKVEDDA